MYIHHGSVGVTAAMQDLLCHPSTSHPHQSQTFLQMTHSLVSEGMHNDIPIGVKISTYVLLYR